MPRIVVLDNLSEDGLNMMKEAGIEYEVRTGLKGEDLRRSSKYIEHLSSPSVRSSPPPLVVCWNFGKPPFHGFDYTENSRFS